MIRQTDGQTDGFNGMEHTVKSQQTRLDIQHRTARNRGQGLLCQRLSASGRVKVIQILSLIGIACVFGIYCRKMAEICDLPDEILALIFAKAGSLSKIRLACVRFADVGLYLVTKFSFNVTSVNLHDMISQTKLEFLRRLRHDGRTLELNHLSARTFEVMKPHFEKFQSFRVRIPVSNRLVSDLLDALPSSCRHVVIRADGHSCDTDAILSALQRFMEHSRDSLLEFELCFPKFAHRTLTLPVVRELARCPRLSVFRLPPGWKPASAKDDVAAVAECVSQLRELQVLDLNNADAKAAAPVLAAALQHCASLEEIRGLHEATPLTPLSRMVFPGVHTVTIALQETETAGQRIKDLGTLFPRLQSLTSTASLQLSVSAHEQLAIWDALYKHTKHLTALDLPGLEYLRFRRPPKAGMLPWRLRGRFALSSTTTASLDLTSFEGLSELHVNGLPVAFENVLARLAAMNERRAIVLSGDGNDAGRFAEFDWARFLLAVCGQVPKTAMWLSGRMLTDIPPLALTCPCPAPAQFCEHALQPIMHVTALTLTSEGHVAHSVAELLPMLQFFPSLRSLDMQSKFSLTTSVRASVHSLDSELLKLAEGMPMLQSIRLNWAGILSANGFCAVIDRLPRLYELHAGTASPDYDVTPAQAQQVAERLRQMHSVRSALLELPALQRHIAEACDWGEFTGWKSLS